MIAHQTGLQPQSAKAFRDPPVSPKPYPQVSSIPTLLSPLAINHVGGEASHIPHGVDHANSRRPAHLTTVSTLGESHGEEPRYVLGRAYPVSPKAYLRTQPTKCGNLHIHLIETSGVTIGVPDVLTPDAPRPCCSMRSTGLMPTEVSRILPICERGVVFVFSSLSCAAA